MQYGAIKIQFEAGEIKGVYINPGMDKIYYNMFNSAKRILKRYPKNPENGVKIIIFGAFFIESICNDLFQKMLSSQILRKKFADSIWEKMKKMSIINKLEVAISASNCDKIEAKKNLKKVQKLLDLRNRLAHSKEKDWFWLKTFKIEDLDNVLKNAPEPELVRELTGKKFKSIPLM